MKLDDIRRKVDKIDHELLVLLHERMGLALRARRFKDEVVDAEREEFILGNLREFFEGRTSILIAHRISAVMNADRIIVLDKGRIVETGKHATLVQSDGIYQRIWRLQQAERQAVSE